MCMVHSEHIHICFIVTILHCAGSTVEPHRIRESGENKSVEFTATVSYFIVVRFTHARSLGSKLYKVHSVSCGL